MRMAILSDTHGRYWDALHALNIMGHYDEIIHLGDTTKDAEIIESAMNRQLIKICGNCDPIGYPTIRLLTISEKRFLATHGDFFGVKYGLADLYEQARSDSAHVVLYGHTHVPFIKEINGILFINPGAVKSSATPTFAVLSIEGDTISAEIVNLKMLETQ